jgi:hypothetical protein
LDTSRFRPFVQADGGDSADTITGTGDCSNASILGGPQNDWIDFRPATGSGIVLYGEDGDDRMWASNTWGCDLIGGTGKDWMTGGAGDDWFYGVDSQWDVISGGAHVNGDHAEIDFPDAEGNDTDWCSGIEFITYALVSSK